MITSVKRGAHEVGKADEGERLFTIAARSPARDIFAGWAENKVGKADEGERLFTIADRSPARDIRGMGRSWR